MAVPAAISEAPPSSKHPGPVLGAERVAGHDPEEHERPWPRPGGTRAAGCRWLGPRPGPSRSVHASTSSERHPALASARRPCAERYSPGRPPTASHAGRARLVGGDLVGRGEGDADVVQAFEEATLRGGSIGKGATSPMAGASTVEALHVDVSSSVGSASMASCRRTTTSASSTIGHQAVLRAVVAEDVREPGRDDGVEAVVLQRPDRVLAAGARRRSSRRRRARWRRRSARRSGRSRGRPATRRRARRRTRSARPASATRPG